MPRDNTRCKGTTRKGEACRAPVVHGREWCVFHDPAPDAQERSRQARIRGGQASSRLARALKHMPYDLREVYDRLGTTLLDVLEGRISPPQATAAAQVARAMVTTLDAAELVEKIARLEELMREWRCAR